MNASDDHLQNHGPRPFGWDLDDDDSWHSFPFERIDFVYWQAFIESTWCFALYAGSLYVLTIFGLQSWMKSRPPFELRMPLFLWNLGLGLFSIMGFARTVPGLWLVFWQPNGFYTCVCIKRYMNIATAYWSLLFFMSKFLELGDTIFIILRKRPLTLIHWYHHLYTMVGFWLCAAYLEPSVRCAVTLNLGVHSLMYPYFALRTLGINIPTKVSNIITTLQLLQMIAGFGVVVLTMCLYGLGYNCVRYPLSIQLSFFGSITYVILFGQLFHDKVLQGETRTK